MALRIRDEVSPMLTYVSSSRATACGGLRAVRMFGVATSTDCMRVQEGPCSALFVVCTHLL